MPRLRRMFFPGVSLHVVQRGNNRCDIFRADGDRLAFLIAVYNACHRFGLDVHAYALMTNHVHFIVTPGSGTALASAMQFVGRHYVPYFNRRYQRTGGLFDGRYRADHIHSETYWYNSVRYVELNPVRAGLVQKPDDYRWSSYRVHALGEANALVSHHPLFDCLGQTPEERQRVWRDQCAAPISDEQLAAIRSTALDPRRVRLQSNPSSAA